MAIESKRFHLRAKGSLACFTRPEMKAERVSYEVMTPSAARGVVESVLWKPAISWRIHSIKVLSPIRWTTFLRNEVSDKVSLRADIFYIEDRRQQRNTVALQDVDYLIEASFRMTEKAGEQDSIVKFEDMMERRLKKGQSFCQAFLGCREFAADVSLGDPDLLAIERGVDRPLGRMFYDFDFRHTPPRPLFFEARLKSGVLEMPPPDLLLKAADGQGGES